jgi:hypothetical protein
VEEASAFGVNEDVAQTIGLLREIEAEQVRPGRAEANQAVMDDYDAGLRRFIATSGAF